MHPGPIIAYLPSKSFQFWVICTHPASAVGGSYFRISWLDLFRNLFSEMTEFTFRAILFSFFPVLINFSLCASKLCLEGTGKKGSSLSAFIHITFRKSSFRNTFRFPDARALFVLPDLWNHKKRAREEHLLASFFEP